jgi:hypothetical protein
MANEPRCSLCQGRLVQNKKVEVSVMNSPIIYPLAWVCIRCSTAFPIALGSGGMIREAKPLYQDGTRHP